MMGSPCRQKRRRRRVIWPNLLVASGAVPGGDLFLIHTEREMQFVEQSGDGAGTDPDAQPEQLPGYLGGCLVRPPSAAHRIAGREVL